MTSRQPGRGAGSGRRVAEGRPLAIAILLGVLLVLVVMGVVLEHGVPSAMAERFFPLRFESEIAAASHRYQVDPYLVAAVVKAESGNDAGAVSDAGAVGLMQLMPTTATWIVARDDWKGAARPDLTDPKDNVELGTYYLAYLLARYGGHVRTALAAYNAGEGVVDGWLAQGQAAGAAESPTTLRPGEIPFPETRGFVDRVEKFRERFSASYPDAFKS